MGTSGIVLAGGKSSRLGRDKTRETFDGKSLLQRVIERIRPLCDDILVVTSQELAAAKASQIDFKIAVDIFPNRGPLGGIYTGLVNSESAQNLVVAGDLPFLNRGLLSYMLQMSNDYELVVPRTERNIEPLHAIYARSCTGPIQKMLEQNRLGVNELAQTMRTRYIELEEIDRFDPEHLSFFNINTQADLDRARELALKEIEK
ncbi:MAG: molybdenum cofactor guanylyltransferase [Dehalococcoidales bacterium]|nr:molybdenum cofactor guanylyltransferase [Dehalococcoidales bacterium]